jgi:hypothetical protein
VLPLTFVQGSISYSSNRQGGKSPGVGQNYNLNPEKLQKLQQGTNPKNFIWQAIVRGQSVSTEGPFLKSEIKNKPA